MNRTYFHLIIRMEKMVAFSMVSIKSDCNLYAILSIIRTISVSIIIGGEVILFSKDVVVFIDHPIEKMLERCKELLRIH